MKIQGVKLGIPAAKLLVFKRVDPETLEEFEIAIKCGAVLSFKEFDSLIPESEPPQRMIPGGAMEPDLESPEFARMITERGTKRFEYMCLKSLEATDGLAWEQVKLEDPETWGLWEQEMEDAGFTAMELKQIQAAVVQVNVMDEDTMEEARQNFLRRQAQSQKESQGS